MLSCVLVPLMIKTTKYVLLLFCLYFETFWFDLYVPQELILVIDSLFQVPRSSNSSQRSESKPKDKCILMWTDIDIVNDCACFVLFYFVFFLRISFVVNIFLFTDVHDNNFLAHSILLPLIFFFLFKKCLLVSSFNLIYLFIYFK